MRDRSLLSWGWQLARPQRRRLVVLGLLSTFEIVLRVASPWAVMVIVDHALGTTPLHGVLADVLPEDRHALLVAVAAIGIAIQLGHQLTIMLHGQLSVRVGQHLIRELREELYAHIQGWRLAHHGAMPTGDAVNRLESDTRCVEQIALRGLFPLVFSVLTLLVMFGVLVAIDPMLAVLSLAIVPPLYVWLRFYTRRIRPHADHARRSDSRLSSRLYANLAAIRLIKSHAREQHEEAELGRVAGDVARAWVAVGHRSAVFAIVTGALTVAGSGLVLLVGGLAVLDGRISLGTLLLVLAYLGYVYGPLSAIATTTGDLQHAFSSARRIRAAFEIDREPADTPDAVPAEQLRGEVRFEGVGFAYRPEEPVLCDVDLHARPGEVVALVGPSGAGKSTLVSLIVRFHDASSGRITIDGVPIEHYQLSSLRERVALVLQDSLVMVGTVRDNLRYGRTTATDAEIEAAARAANAHDFIMALPRGYDTELGEGGTSLSGGQRQRLSIARAFVKNAAILILDEPTAALDTISERQVIEAVRRLWAGRTTFVVAHRLSTVRDADRILVMERGRIVAGGTHDELLERSPLYARLATQLTG